jgi:20S proteasome alpha/beta subunit
MMSSLFLIILVSIVIQIAFTESVYKSLTELDKYGSCPQINNAQMASNVQSMPTIVSASRSSVVVVALEKKQAGVLPRNKCQIIGKSDDQIIASIPSGLSGDAAFLTKILRKDVMNIWERYDSIPDCSRVAHTASRIMLTFMKYDNELGDGARDVMLDDSGERLSIGRPLGVKLVVASVNTSGHVKMRLIEPSGVVSDEIVGRVLGRGYKKGNELLRTKWRHDIDTVELIGVCADILREVAASEYIIGDNAEGDYCIVIEVFDCQNGMNVRRIPFSRESNEQN